MCLSHHYKRLREVLFIKGWNPFMGMPCLSVARSLCPVGVQISLTRKDFGIRFSEIDVKGPKSVKACF
jgi:hypothetical protein